MLQVDYEDEDIPNILLPEDRLVLGFCEPVELQKIFNKAKNMIVALKPFIVGKVAFEDSVDVSSQDVGLEAEVRHRPIPFPQRERTRRKRQRV